MQIKYKMSEQDFMDFNLFAHKRIGAKSRKARLLWFVPFFGLYFFELFRFCQKALLDYECFLYFNKHFFSSFVSISFIVIFIPVATILIVIQKITFKNYIKKVYDSLDKNTLEGTLSIETDKLVDITKISTMNIDFDKIKTIHEDKANFYILYSDIQGYILPVNENSKEFIRILCEKTGEGVQK